MPSGVAFVAFSNQGIWSFIYFMRSQKSGHLFENILREHETLSSFTLVRCWNIDPDTLIGTWFSKEYFIYSKIS